MEPIYIILHTVSGVFVRANVGSDNAELFTNCEVSGEILQALAVESKAIDDRSIFQQAEHSRPWITGLWKRRDGATFHKGNPCLEHWVEHFRVFVEARRQADATAEVEAPNFSSENGVVSRTFSRSKSVTENRNRQVMCGLSVEEESQCPRADLMQNAHGYLAQAVVATEPHSPRMVRLICSGSTLTSESPIDCFERSVNPGRIVLNNSCTRAEPTRPSDQWGWEATT